LPAEAREQLRTARRFVNAGEVWLLRSEEQVTVEVQFTSSQDPKLPKLFFHYAVMLSNQEVIVLDEGDRLLAEFDLLPSTGCRDIDDFFIRGKRGLRD
jgi:hypothetical protein